MTWTSDRPDVQTDRLDAAVKISEFVVRTVPVSVRLAARLMSPCTSHGLSGPEANGVLKTHDTTESITALQEDRHEIRVEGVKETKDAVQHTNGVSKPRFDSVEDTIEAFSRAPPDPSQFHREPPPD